MTGTIFLLLLAVLPWDSAGGMTGTIILQLLAALPLDSALSPESCTGQSFVLGYLSFGVLDLFLFSFFFLCLDELDEDDDGLLVLAAFFLEECLLFEGTRALETHPGKILCFISSLILYICLASAP